MKVVVIIPGVIWFVLKSIPIAIIAGLILAGTFAAWRLCQAAA